MFTAVMMKYVCCSLFGVFLLLGIFSILNKDKEQKIMKQDDDITLNMQCNDLFHSIKSEAVIQLSFGKKLNINRTSCHYNGQEGILGGRFILSRSYYPCKILKTNLSVLNARISDFFNSRIIGKSWIFLSFYTNQTQFSCRYYIYMLGHILI